MLKAYDNFFDLNVNPVALAALRHSEDFATDESKWQQQRLQSQTMVEELNTAAVTNSTESPSMADSDNKVTNMFLRWIPLRLLIRYFIITCFLVILEQVPGLSSTMSTKEP